jgi:kynurenine 3-monooxygenase
MAAPVTILGAGLSGHLLAILLARRGLKVTIYDRGAAPGAEAHTAGRSINLALAARGIRALEQASVFAAVEPLLLPMTGRVVHDSAGSDRFLPYGQSAAERIWSVSREALNRTLYEIGRDQWRIDYRFGHRCVGFDAARIRLRFQTADGETDCEPELLLAADGAGSIVRRELAAAGLVRSSEALLDHGYKELLIPARPDGGFALAPGGLHIWPRGGFMLIALPNLDRSFTATLFLPLRGSPGFDSVGGSAVSGGAVGGGAVGGSAVGGSAVGPFFAAHFSDVVPLIPGLEQEFSSRPVGTLGTVHCSPWSHADASGRRLLLIGDAAHAIVPFHGQGMNAAFEDCACLDQLLGELGPDWAALIPRFEAARQDNARAIAAMALENYVEMRDAVRDPDFERRAALAFELERRCRGRFIPRYAMVMFHPEIEYAEAERRGRIQAAILDEAMREGEPAAALALAERRVRKEL